LRRLSISFTVIGFPASLNSKPLSVEACATSASMRSATSLGVRHRALGGGEEQLLELADGELVQLMALEEEGLGLVDEDGVAGEGGAGLAGGLGAGVVDGRDVGEGLPLGVALEGDEGLVGRVDEEQKAVGAFLRGIGIGGEPVRQAQG
jgi:hypothetical protein